MRSASAPPTPQPPTPPDPPPARSDPIIAQNEERDKQRRKRGRAATILTGNAGQGDMTAPITGTTALLGGNP